MFEGAVAFNAQEEQQYSMLKRGADINV